MIIAQITDLHVPAPGTVRKDGFDPAADLQTCLDVLARFEPKPDLVLLTGDLVNDGTQAEYRRLKEMLDPLPLPCYLLAGNHDGREALRAVFGPLPYLGGGMFLHWTLDADPVRIIALDTLQPGEICGALCAERLAWFEAALAEAPETPTLVAMHHPPYITGIVELDNGGFGGMAAFRQLIKQNPQVKLIISGHAHRNIGSRIGGASAVTCPSTTFALGAGLYPGAPFRKTAEAPGFMLHLWQGDGFVTHTVLVNDAEHL